MRPPPIVGCWPGGYSQNTWCWRETRPGAVWLWPRWFCCGRQERACQPERFCSLQRMRGVSMPDYDVVVVGAGSAGCALTSRLCHVSALSVCLVEAGPDYGPAGTGHWPAELLSVQDLPHTHDWGYREERAGGQSVPEARAKVVGGCSAHNQCGAFWGLPAEYAAWGAGGLAGWSYSELAPLMQQLERASP